MLAWVALAGALGALARYGVHGLVQSRVASQFPCGTVVVNVTGSFVLGLVVGLATYQGLDPDLSVGVSIERRIVAVALADQLGAAFAADSPLV